MLLTFPVFPVCLLFWLINPLLSLSCACGSIFTYLASSLSVCDTVSKVLDCMKRLNRAIVGKIRQRANCPPRFSHVLSPSKLYLPCLTLNIGWWPTRTTRCSLHADSDDRSPSMLTPAMPQPRLLVFPPCFLLLYLNPFSFPCLPPGFLTLNQYHFLFPCLPPCILSLFLNPCGFCAYPGEECNTICLLRCFLLLSGPINLSLCSPFSVSRGSQHACQSSSMHATPYTHIATPRSTYGCSCSTSVAASGHSSSVTTSSSSSKNLRLSEAVVVVVAPVAMVPEGHASPVPEGAPAMVETMTGVLGGR